MVAVTQLYHANGGSPEAPQCRYCGAYLGLDRAVAHSPLGAIFFCKADPEYPQDSCYLSWRRNHH